MKRKLLIPTLTSIALAPTIAMVGCNEPEPEPKYYEYEIKWDGEHYKTDELTLLKGNYYKFWINDLPQYGSVPFYFIKNGLGQIKVMVWVDKVLSNNIEIDYQLSVSLLNWNLKLLVPQAHTKIEIYLKCFETIENVFAHLV